MDLILFPSLIYIGKVIELSLNSIRIVAISKGFKYLAISIAFVEAIVWILIVTRIIENIANPLNLLAFAAGHATGCYMGIFIEEKLALGLVFVRVITQKNADTLLIQLRDIGFRITDVNATSNYGAVKIIFATIKRKNLKSFTTMVHKFNKHAFYTIEEIKSASQTIRKPSGLPINRFFSRLTTFTPSALPTKESSDNLEISVEIPAEKAQYFKFKSKDTKKTED